MITQNKRLTLIILAVPMLLLIPFFGTLFTDEVDWSPSDFIIMGTLLLGTGLLVELVLRKVHKMDYRVAFILAILVIFLIIWAELAVGVFGSPFAGS